MSLSYRILPDLGVVYVRYEGFARIADTAETFGRYMQDPDFRPGQRQLIDLARLTGYERDFLKFFELQAQKAEAFVSAPQALFVYYAPTPLGQELVQLIRRSWEGTSIVVQVVQDDEAEALALLGVRETSFDALVERMA
jgi:hypothetical protein